MANMKASANCYELIKAFEGLHAVKADGTVRAYICPAGKWTIGYGSTKGVRSGMNITQQEAEDLLVKDVNEFEAAVNRLVKVPLTQNQFDALVSFAFNVGSGNLSSSTLLRKLNVSDYDAVPSELLRWNKARVNGVLTPLKGLTRRRSAEAALFSMDAPLASQSKEIMPQKVCTEEVKPIVKSRTMAGLGLAGVSTALSEVSTQLQPLTTYSSTITTVFLILTVVGIGIAAYARMDDQRKAER
jgi:lysozyme